ncbi:MAG: M23 family metallopeptidase [bacterium]|nr:M23 family metallopeptidase [bacterium]
MSVWKWLFGSRKRAPSRIRVYLVPDKGHDSVERIVPLLYFRLMVAAAVVGVLALLFLVFSSGSLFIEKQERRILERRLEEMNKRVARVHSLEIQLEETTLVLLKIQEMLGNRAPMPDSLLQSMVARESRAGEAMALLEGDLSIEGQQMLHTTPNTWPVVGWVSRVFVGKRGPTYHPGIDIVAEMGTPVRSAGDGIVLVAGWNDEYGNFVLVEHGFGITTLYAHNSSLSVRKEDRVKSGDVIAFLGNTGRSTGAHLHFEVRRNGIPVDPKNYLLD